ncbi:MAG: peroxiredoxin [Planctomycetes bacterium]|nr:peroxiredoxin [Planctomycetota bacterium]
MHDLVWIVTAGVGLMALGFVGCSSEKPATSGPATESAGKTEPMPAASPAPPASLVARTGLVPVGEAAPDFEAKDHQGNLVRLSDLLKTEQVVLVFYPADFTSGCTKQLCHVRDDWTEFRKRHATCLGVNPADVEKHASFVKEHSFPFPILNDEASRIAAAYGCKGEKYTNRTVYVIGRDGKVKLGESGMVPHEKMFAALDSQ